jgi:hypothetical protein
VLAKINDSAYKIDIPQDVFGGVSDSFNVADLTPYDGEDLGASRSTPFEEGGEDEDIHIESPPPTTNEIVDVAAKDKSNEVRIGPMTRARAKLLNQQVNSLLNEFDVCIDENFILPKSMHICMIRFESEEFMEQGGKERDEKIIHGCAREEREEGAPQEEGIIRSEQNLLLPVDCPAETTRQSGKRHQTVRLSDAR